MNLDLVSLDLVFTMSKIGHFQNCLEEIFDEFTPKFVNKMHWIQLQYRVEKNKRILVVVKVLRKEAEKETLKSAMYVTQIRDLGLSASVFSWIVSNSRYLEIFRIMVR